MDNCINKYKSKQTEFDFQCGDDIDNIDEEITLFSHFNHYDIIYCDFVEYDTPEIKTLMIKVKLSNKINT